MTGLLGLETLIPTVSFSLPASQLEVGENPSEQPFRVLAFTVLLHVLNKYSHSQQGCLLFLPFPEGPRPGIGFLTPS